MNRMNTASKTIRLARPYIDEQEAAALKEVLDSGWVMQGPRTEQFERAILEYCGAEHCIAVSSGTAALHLGLLALGIGAGDAVFVPSFAWPAAANAAVFVGATPVFVDVSPHTYNIDCDDLWMKINLSANSGLHPALVTPVHQFGVPCDIHQVISIAQDYHMNVLEDSACALGSWVDGCHVGLFGRLGVLSFHPRKIITTGEGGAIITNDSSVAEKCRRLSNHGHLQEPGLNYRLSDLHAAVGLAQMNKLTAILDHRRRLVRVYARELRALPGLITPACLDALADDHLNSISLQTLMVYTESPALAVQLRQAMSQAGIETRAGSVASHRLPSFKDCSPSDDPCPVATELEQCGIALPLHPSLSSEDIEYIAGTIRHILTGKGTNTVLSQTPDMKARNNAPA